MRSPGNPEIIVNRETFPLSVFDPSKYSIDKENKTVHLQEKTYELSTNKDVEKHIILMCRKHNVEIKDNTIIFIMEKHPYFYTASKIDFSFLLDLQSWKFKIHNPVVIPHLGRLNEILMERS